MSEGESLVNESLRARVAELEAALWPFVKKMDASYADLWGHVADGCLAPLGRLEHLTHGDLRRAAAVMACAGSA